MLQKRHLLILTIFLTVTFSFSQERIGEFINDLKKNNTALTESFSVLNEKTNNTATFLTDKTNTYGYLTDDKFNVLKKIGSQKKKRKYRELIGSTSDDKENYLIIYSNADKNKFALNKLSFNGNKSELIEDSFDTNGLVFLQSISTNDKIHLIFIKELSSILLIRSYDIKTNVSSMVLDLSNEVFSTTKKNQVPLSKLMYFKKKGTKMTAPNSAFYSLLKITKKYNKPISLEDASEMNKLYIDEHQLTFTFDKNKNYTQILNFNLSTAVYSTNKIEKPLFNITDRNKKTNSIILGDKIFIASSSQDKMEIQMNSITNNKVLKKHTILADQDIKINNTPIIQEGATYNKYRELKTTKQFLYKINSSDIGISAFKIKDNIEVTIGGVKKVLSTEAAITGMMFGPLASASGASITYNNHQYFNDYMHSYNSYGQTKSVYFKGVFNTSFEHLKNEKKSENIFDIVKNYIKKRPSIQLINVFKNNNDVILGGYLMDTKSYFFHKFD